MTQPKGRQNDKAAIGQEPSPDALSASIQILPLPPGLYLFSVQAAAPTTSRALGQLSLPAVQVSLGPGVRSDQVEFIDGPANQGTWLFAPGDLLIAKINDRGATLILNSVRAPQGDVLSIKVERLEARGAQSAAEAGIAAAKPAAAGAAAPRGDKTTTPAIVTGASDGSVALQIGAHIRSRGDMNFVDAPWVGRIGRGLWIESFSIRPLARFGAQDIEYKGLTGSGFETPWLSDDQMCGTKGMSVPLVGFAVRLKPSTAAAAYDCEYTGYFQSGVTVGPLRNGAPCRSTVANDPLEGMQIRLIQRAVFGAAAAPVRAAAKSAPLQASKGRSPSRAKSTRSTRSPSLRRP